MQLMLPKLFKLLYMHDKDVLFNPAFFEPRRANAIGATLIMPKPVTQYKDKAVEPGYKIGVRGNGVDKPMWPEDLSVEIVQ
ncbi:hypothetical protein MAP00_000779 [Monascus purpureus]|nr:hypothetical protein MAP00_000779 [Monascus purpureus]